MKVDRLKEHVFAIVLIEPWPILCCLSWIRVIKNACAAFFLEHHRTLHALDDLLSTITMMNIEVYNCNPFYFIPMLVQEISCSNCYVVYVAKAIGLLSSKSPTSYFRWLYTRTFATRIIEQW